MSTRESELDALGALSAELNFTQAILRDWTVIPGARKSRQQHSTNSGNETGRKLENETRVHTRFLFIQDFVFPKLLTMSAVKADVNPSDIGPKTVGREGFNRMRAMLGLGNELADTCSPGNLRDV